MKLRHLRTAAERYDGTCPSDAWLLHRSAMELHDLATEAYAASCDRLAELLVWRSWKAEFAASRRATGVTRDILTNSALQTKGTYYDLRARRLAG